jgi:hypothetical protein
MTAAGRRKPSGPPSALNVAGILPEILRMMVVTAPPIMVMMVVVTTPPAVMVMVMPPSMMVMMILRQRHVRIRHGRLSVARGFGGIHGLQHRERIRDRLEQLGVGFRGSQPRRVRGLESGGLGAVESREA